MGKIIILIALFAIINIHLAWGETIQPENERNSENLPKLDLDQKSILQRRAKFSFKNNAIKAADTQPTKKEYSANIFFKVNWFAAQKICSSQGLTLASINSYAEDLQLRRYLLENGLTGEKFWLSGNRLAGQFVWFWMSSGNIFSYRNWDDKEPNNAGGNEQCMAISEKGKWFDIPCNTEYFFICENRCELPAETPDNSKE